MPPCHPASTPLRRAPPHRVPPYRPLSGSPPPVACLRASPQLIQHQTDHHVKDSEKRVLTRKALMQCVRSQELGRRLHDIIIKKIRLSLPAATAVFTMIYYISTTESTELGEDMSQLV